MFQLVSDSLMSVAGIFKGAQKRFREFQERSLEIHWLSGVFQEFSRGFKGVPGVFRRYLGRSRKLA